MIIIRKAEELELNQSNFCNLIGSFRKSYVFVESGTPLHADSSYS